MTLRRTVSVGCAIVSFSGGAAAQRVSAPTTALMDEVLDIRVSGLRPGERVTLRATMGDSAQRSWSAEAVYVASARGDIVLTRDAPAAGSYTGVDPMGLVTSMELPDQRGVAVYSPPSLGDVPLTLALNVDGRIVDSLTIVRRFLSLRARTVTLGTAGGPIGTLILPEQASNAPAVLVLGGSEGGNSAVDVAAQLAARGYATLSLAYFGAGGLPAELDEIPLEYFTRAITFLSKQPGVDSTAVAIFGSSKGAEAALLVAAQDARVRAVVAYSPSSVVWSCICSSANHSSWSHEGKGVPYVPAGRDPTVKLAPGEPQRPTVHYTFRMRNIEAVAAATIPVERIRGPVMLVAGGADDLWPSAEMARQIRARLAAASRPTGDTLLIYSDAGHRIGKSFIPAGSTRVAGGRIETGGTRRANARAQADAWPGVLQFLARELRR